MSLQIFYGQDTPIHLECHFMNILIIWGDKGKTVFSYLLKLPFPLGVKYPNFGTNT